MSRTVGNVGWTFLSNHGHVLVAIARRPEQTVREIADAVGITERATAGIINDLEADGYLTRARVGRRNQYRLDVNRPLRHPSDDAHRIGELLSVLASEPS